MGQLRKERGHKLVIPEMKLVISDITINPIDIKMIINEYYEQLNAHKFNNLNEMDQFLEKYNLPKVTDEIDNVNRPVSIK